MSEQVSTGQVEVAKAIKMVDEQLAQKGNLVGDGKKVTLADLVVWAVLSEHESNVASSQHLQKFFDKIKTDRALAAAHTLVGKYETSTKSAVLFPLSFYFKEKFGDADNSFVIGLILI